METLGKTDVDGLQLDSQQEEISLASRLQTGGTDTIVLDDEDETDKISDFEDDKEW